MLWGLWEQKLLGSSVLSSSATEVSVSRVSHLAMLARSIEDVPGCLGGDSPRLIWTTELMAASLLLL